MSASPQVAESTVQPALPRAQPPARLLRHQPEARSDALIQPPTKAARLRKPNSNPRWSLRQFRSRLQPKLCRRLISRRLAPLLPHLKRAGTVQPESADRSVDKTAVMAVKPAGNSGENAEDIAEINSGVPLGRYFDVGSFKDELGARSATDDLARIGIHAMVVPKHHLWMNSYQVIAGPYRDGDEMQAAGTNLRSHGFKTHSLPKQSRDLTLRSLNRVSRFRGTTRRKSRRQLGDLQPRGHRELCKGRGHGRQGRGKVGKKTAFPTITTPLCTSRMATDHEPFSKFGFTV